MAPLVQCAACKARFDEEAWASLEIAVRLEPADVRRLVLGWPESHWIEVRRCSGCHRSIASRRGVSPA